MRVVSCLQQNPDKLSLWQGGQGSLWDYVGTGDEVRDTFHLPLSAPHDILLIAYKF